MWPCYGVHITVCIALCQPVHVGLSGFSGFSSAFIPPFLLLWSNLALFWHSQLWTFDVWLYHKADFEHSPIYIYIYSPLTGLLSYPLMLIDSSWNHFKSLFLDAVYKFVPSKLLPSTPLPPWLPHSLVSKIKQRQYLYRKAKETSSTSPSQWILHTQKLHYLRNSLSQSKIFSEPALIFSSSYQFLGFCKIST